jgi:hypothetical protein
MRKTLWVTGVISIAVVERAGLFHSQFNMEITLHLLRNMIRVSLLLRVLIFLAICETTSDTL